MSGCRKHIKLLAILFHSLAICIIVFGSIINFHQYKIWGKPLIPQFVGIKRDIDKATKVLSGGNLIQKHDFTQKFSPLSAGILPVEISRHSSGTAIMTNFDLCYKVPEMQHLTSSGLRAPPQS
ncbi:MAG: hypothetical protein WCI48_03455 [Bacteroidota bacterium]|jgi:hypothetical protein